MMSIKEAMQYLITQKIGEENFKTLTLLGFIKRGKEISNKDSWKATKLLEEFLKPYNEKISFFDKIRYYINSKLS